MSVRYASDRLPWRRLGLIGVLAGAALFLCLGGIWVFYQALGHPRHDATPAQFPAPALNISDDRTRAWRLARPPSPALKVAIAHAMARVAARGEAGYDAGPP